MKLPRPGMPPLTWDDHVVAIREVAQAPNVAGSLARTSFRNKAGQSLHQIADDEKKSPPPRTANRDNAEIRGFQDNRPVCRDHTAGRCTRAFCKFRHVPIPAGQAPSQRPICSYCKRPGHSIDRCFKKQREESANSVNDDSPDEFVFSVLEQPAASILAPVHPEHFKPGLEYDLLPTVSPASPEAFGPTALLRAADAYEIFPASPAASGPAALPRASAPRCGCQFCAFDPDTPRFEDNFSNAVSLKLLSSHARLPAEAVSLIFSMVGNFRGPSVPDSLYREWTRGLPRPPRLPAPVQPRAPLIIYAPTCQRPGCACHGRPIAIMLPPELSTEPVDPDKLPTEAEEDPDPDEEPEPDDEPEPEDPDAIPLRSPVVPAEQPAVEPAEHPAPIDNAGPPRTRAKPAEGPAGFEPTTYHSVHALGDPPHEVTNNSARWLLDSGATCNLTKNRDNCFDIKQERTVLHVAGGGQLVSTETGSCRVHYELGGRPRSLLLRSVRIVPELHQNILAEGQLLQAACGITKRAGRLLVETPDPHPQTILDLQADARGLYYLLPAEPASPTVSGPPIGTEMAFSLARSFNDNTNDLHLWHQRLGHRNMTDVARMIGVPPPSKPCFCSACVQAKSAKHPLTGSGIEPLGAAPRPAYLFHSDAMGPFRTPTRSGKRHVLILVDDYSRRCFVFLLKTTAEFFSLFKDFVARLEADFGKDKVIAQLRADGAGYYLENSALRAFCKQKGIYQVFSAPNTPELNAVSERTNRTLLEMTRALLIHAGAPSFLWGEAITYAAYVLDRCCRTFPDGDYNTPLARWHQRAHPRAHLPLRVWGCTAFKHVAFDNQDKLQPKAVAHMFLGIDETPRMCY